MARTKTSGPNPHSLRSQAIFLGFFHFRILRDNSFSATFSNQRISVSPSPKLSSGILMLKQNGSIAPLNRHSQTQFEELPHVKRGLLKG